MAGAQAAAGDLLRARSASGPQVAEPDVDERVVQAASALFTVFEAFYKARRMYQSGHPALDRFFGQLETKLAPALAFEGELTVALVPLGLQLQGTSVFKAERPEQNMWFPLYRDGIRELTFSEGVERDQIERFCGAIVQLASVERDSDEDDGEDDAVTLLWDLALDDIGYVAIDSFVDGTAADDEARARVERIREIVTVSMMKELVVSPAAMAAGSDVERARRLKTVALSSADLRVFERDNLMALDELPARIREANGDLFSTTPEERGALARGVQHDAALDEKLIDAIIATLLDDGGAEHGDALCARVERTFTAMVVDRQFERAAGVRRRVLAARGAGPHAELWARLDAAMSAAPALAAISGALAAYGDDAVGPVIGLVEVMPAASAAMLLTALGSIEQRSRRRWVCDVIATWGAAAVDGCAAALPASSEEIAVDLLYLLRCVASPAAATALERATHHAAAPIRAASLRLLAEIAAIAELAPRVRACMRDEDVRVRACAVELVLARRPPGSERWVDEAIRAESFADLDLGEKKRLFLAYGTVGGERAATDLLARLEQRNLLQRSSIDDERAAAASALGQLRHAPARTALEKLARSKVVRANVRTACSEALEALDRPRAAQPTAPPELSPGAALAGHVAPLEHLANADPLEHVEASIENTAPKVTFKVGAPAAALPAAPSAVGTSPLPRVPTSEHAAGTSRLPRAPTSDPAAHAATAAWSTTPAHAAGTSTLPRVPATASQPAQPVQPAQPFATTRPLDRASPTPASRMTTPGVAPAAREPSTRPDPRSASGRRPIDDGVAVRRDSRSASGVRPVDDGVVVRPRAGTAPVRAATAPTTTRPATPATPPAGASTTRAGWRAPVTTEDERGVPRSPRRPSDDKGSDDER